MYSIIYEKRKPYKDSLTALAFKGPKSPTYLQIKTMAQAITHALKNNTDPIIVIVENDFAKALGLTIKTIVKDSKKVICLDKIKVDTGDYVDIGKAISNIVPVVVKTLIFKN